MTKLRLSTSVDADLVAAGQEAVSAGEAESLSAWVNEALRLQVDRERRLRALDHFIAGYEEEHGEITEDEIADVTRRTRGRAVVVRGEHVA